MCYICVFSFPSPVVAYGDMFHILCFPKCIYHDYTCMSDIFKYNVPGILYICHMGQSHSMYSHIQIVLKQSNTNISNNNNVSIVLGVKIKMHTQMYCTCHTSLDYVKACGLILLYALIYSIHIHVLISVYSNLSIEL